MSPGFSKALLAGALLLPAGSPASVVINEFMAASSEKRLSWEEAGVPRLGSGLRWMDPEFAATGWIYGTMPAGYSFAGLKTDLTALMKGKAPSVYFRKEFQVSAEQAASTNRLVLGVVYNDGFVAYLNGREIARANCGASNQFIFASQPAYNVNPSIAMAEFSIGPASAWLLASTNVLAIQAHNAEMPSTTAEPQKINSHTPTPEFRIAVGVRLVEDTNSPPVSTNIIDIAESGTWRYWVGRVEPCSGVIDMGLVTKVFVPPTGEEDDYDAPADFSDWIELANYGTEPVDISGWSLTDTRDTPGLWRFPTNSVLQPGKLLLVLCDQREDANPPAGPATYLHTNFKLEGNGEYLALYDNWGRYVDGFSDGYPAQVHHCSYGRNPDAPTTFGYFARATPGAANGGTFYSARVAPPQFVNSSGAVLPGGIYATQPVSLYLGSPTPGSSVRYTTNGTVPTESNGFVFSEPVVLTQPNVKIAVVIRARAFRPGFMPSETVTHTYLLRQPPGLGNSPVLCFTADANQSFYPPQGLLAIVGGQWSSSIWLAGGPTSYNNALGAGPPFEREAHVQFCFPPSYYPSNQAPFAAHVGMRVSSSPWSRPRLTLRSWNSSPWPVSSSEEKTSFNLYFSGDYGSGSMNYPLFTNYPVSKFQHLRLRAGKNDIVNPFITDELVRRLFIDLGHAGSRGLFCSVYFNGVYKGIFNLCERFREPFFQEHEHSTAKWDICYSGSWVDGNATEYNRLTGLLDKDLTNLSNYQSAVALLDLENAADYYQLNIYGATWDWPGNNYVLARERSAGPENRFRFAVWDAEGAFYAIGYGGKSVSYNTITSDLMTTSTAPLQRIFRRLVSSPEFRLFFADRINRNFFNGGVLDDRDPDGAGPLKARFRSRLDELVSEAGSMVLYNSGQTINQSAFNAWMSTLSGRRSYLLGTNAGRRFFRDAGLWPVTEPPVFSRHGGAVPPGFELSMTSSVAVTGQTSTIYFSLDRSDPRLIGGALNPNALLYTNPITLDKVVTVKARAKNSTTGEWSPLTEATFAPATVPAGAENLVIAEMMYHPPGPTAAEVAIGFINAEDFEFVRLLNIGDAPVDLAGVRFTLGITFDFNLGNVRFLNPGANLLVVKRQAAFQIRYGKQYDNTIAGEYGGNLANGGERIQLLATNNAAIKDFVFGDAVPWPTSPDGLGPSLMLREPYSDPDHALAANWMASSAPGGMPGGVAPAQTYATWRNLYWDRLAAANPTLSGQAADPDGDGLSNLAEYALGLDPHIASAPPLLTCVVEVIEGEPHTILAVRLAGAATEATVVWESSSDLKNWWVDPSAFQLLESEPALDGTALFRYLENSSPLAVAQRFIRFKIQSASPSP